MIFILGIARSGTTILYKSLASHPEYAYFCTAQHKRIPRILAKKRWLAPLEGWAWHRFSETMYVDDEGGYKSEFKQAVYDCLKWWGKPDFIGKNPSICLRIKWLTSIYPDAQYVLIKRDLHANLESLMYHMNCDYDQADDYRRIFQNALDHDKHLIKNLWEIDYEDFCKKPLYYCRHITECDNKKWDVDKIKLPMINNMNYRHRI